MPCHRSQQLTERLPGAPTAPELRLETHPCFDSRQRCIIGGLERLIAMCGAPGGRDLTAEMDRLLDRMLEQVTTEDRFLVLVGFPGAKGHVLRHRVLLIDTARLRYRLSKGALLPGELEVLRLRWLEHTLEDDGRFVAFLEQGGERGTPVTARNIS